ncbi:MAG: hypothetical protein ACRDAO_03435 [Culicoidibacterales bacterium]
MVIRHSKLTLIFTICLATINFFFPLWFIHLLTDWNLFPFITLFGIIAVIFVGFHIFTWFSETLIIQDELLTLNFGIGKSKKVKTDIPLNSVSCSITQSKGWLRLFGIVTVTLTINKDQHISLQLRSYQAQTLCEQFQKKQLLIIPVPNRSFNQFMALLLLDTKFWHWSLNLTFLYILTTLIIDVNFLQTIYLPRFVVPFIILTIACWLLNGYLLFGQLQHAAIKRHEEKFTLQMGGSIPIQIAFTVEDIVMIEQQQTLFQLFIPYTRVIIHLDHNKFSTVKPFNILIPTNDLVNWWTQTFPMFLQTTPIFKPEQRAWKDYFFSYPLLLTIIITGTCVFFLPAYNTPFILMIGIICSLILLYKSFIAWKNNTLVQSHAYFCVYYARLRPTTRYITKYYCHSFIQQSRTQKRIGLGTVYFRFKNQRLPLYTFAGVAQKKSI